MTCNRPSQQPLQALVRRQVRLSCVEVAIAAQNVVVAGIRLLDPAHAPKLISKLKGLRAVPRNAVGDDEQERLLPPRNGAHVPTLHDKPDLLGGKAHCRKRIRASIREDLSAFHERNRRPHKLGQYARQPIFGALLTDLGKPPVQRLDRSSCGCTRFVTKAQDCRKGSVPRSVNSLHNPSAAITRQRLLPRAANLERITSFAAPCPRGRVSAAAWHDAGNGAKPCKSGSSPPVWLRTTPRPHAPAPARDARHRDSA